MIINIINILFAILFAIVLVMSFGNTFVTALIYVAALAGISLTYGLVSMLLGE
jgi:hypothetical protein